MGGGRGWHHRQLYRVFTGRYLTVRQFNTFLYAHRTAHNRKVQLQASDLLSVDTATIEGHSDLSSQIHDTRETF